MAVAIDPAAIEAAEAIRQRGDDAAEALTRNEAAHREALRSVADIETAWATGDESPTALDYATAQAEVLRTSKLATKAENDLTVILRRNPVLGLELAQALGERIAPMFGDLNLTVTTTLPPKPTKAADAPHLWLIQQKNANPEGGGILSGQFRLVLDSAQPYMTIPPIESMFPLLERGGWLVNVKRTDPERVTEGAYRSVATIDVIRGWLPVPAITEGTVTHSENRAPRNWITNLEDVTRAAVQQASPGYTITLDRFAVRTVKRSAVDDGPTVAETVDLAADLAGRVSDYSASGHGFNGAERLAMAGPLLIGTLIPWLGVVTMAEPIDAERPSLRLAVIRAAANPTDANTDEDTDE